jgi:hypothetical protein
VAKVRGCGLELEGVNRRICGWEISFCQRRWRGEEEEGEVGNDVKVVLECGIIM